MMLKQIFTNWKIVKKILYTLGFIFLFRFGSLISIPGVTLTASDLAGSEGSGSFLGILNILGGGGLATFSLFALGVTPYITASIIIQLLSSDVIPPLARLNKQGEKGRIKLEKITRILSIFFAIIQGLAITLAMQTAGKIEIANNGWGAITFIILIMITGSMISMWIADQITMKGVGNGTSLIILSGIVAAIPYKFMGAWDNFVVGEGVKLFVGFISFTVYMLIAVGTIFVLSFFETSERRIPIQQTGQGLNLVEDKQTYLPIKLNPAGVVPVIFASAMITLPPTIAQFFPDSNSKEWVVTNFALTSPLGLTLYGLLIIAFTYFYSQININPEETAENFQKSSTFIIGVKPGEETKKYLTGVINSVATFGGFILAFIAMIPYFLTFIGVPQQVAIGGTSMIIATSVAIDTWDQLKSRAISEETKKQIRTKNNEKKYSKFGTAQKIEKKNTNKENVLFE